MSEPVSMLSVSYDKAEKFEEIKPLLDQLHDFCKANDIPYIFSANVKVDTESHTHQTVSSALLIGAERTPGELAVANMAIVEGIPQAVQLASALLGVGYTGRTMPDEDASGFAEDGPKPTVSGAGHA